MRYRLSEEKLLDITLPDKKKGEPKFAFSYFGRVDGTRLHPAGREIARKRFPSVPARSSMCCSFHTAEPQTRDSGLF